MTTGPFHEGERYVQERAGEQTIAERNGGIIADFIPARAIAFLAEQRMLAIGTVDEQGAPSASVLFGARGLASSADGRSLVIDRTRIDVISDDAVWSNLRIAVPVGLLAIDLGSRRRLRVNGVVVGLNASSIDVMVREAYPNCPKYIQRRQLRAGSAASPNELQPGASGISLDEVRISTVERADTLFVASGHPTRGVDVSHRGGEAGFVRVVDPSCLRIPDYRGNSMFNTLGNFIVDDRAGLVFLDFERGSLLQMSGTVVVRFNAREDARQPTGGSGRNWDFHVRHWLELPMLTPAVWELLDHSPYNPIAIK